MTVLEVGLLAIAIYLVVLALWLRRERRLDEWAAVSGAQPPSEEGGVR